MVLSVPQSHSLSHSPSILTNSLRHSHWLTLLFPIADIWDNDGKLSLRINDIANVSGLGKWMLDRTSLLSEEIVSLRGKSHFNACLFTRGQVS
ncbi:hypothetical protein TNCV_2074771 [Trichonephila clavipes]|nr:hypothetical protein TNCV_2074771 [Trichonephila clavipes]